MCRYIDTISISTSEFNCTYSKSVSALWLGYPYAYMVSEISGNAT